MFFFEFRNFKVIRSIIQKSQPNRVFWNFEKELTTSWTHIDNHWVWENGFEIHTGINLTTEGVFKDFQISFPFEDDINRM